VNSIRRHSVGAIAGQIIAEKQHPGAHPGSKRLTIALRFQRQVPGPTTRRVPDGAIGPPSTRARTRCYIRIDYLSQIISANPSYSPLTNSLARL
jgi:hypothetical protein